MKASAAKALKVRLLAAAMLAGAALPAQESKPLETVRALKDRTERGKLSDRRELVRGDTGKWSDTPKLLYAAALEQKPEDVTLDDFAEGLSEGAKRVTSGPQHHWLIFRTRQLDDNDRAWVEKIERRGNEFVVTLSEAIWKGQYFKTFTYYEVTAVNLGKLPPGEYKVTWVVKPLTFKQLEKPAQPGKDNKDNWPVDEPVVGGEPMELHAAFSVR